MKRRLCLLVVALGFSAAGCFGAARRPASVQYYRLDYTPPAAGSERLPVAVRVLPFRVATPYAGPGIVYREGAHRLGTYAYDRWASDPGGMVADLLVRDLVSSGRYAAVERGPSLLRADYELAGEIEEMEERVEDGSRAHLQLRILVRQLRGEREVLYQRRYQADEPSLGSDAAAVVDALSRALASLSARLQSDLDEALRGREKGTVPFSQRSP